jgi:hypothetical protein
LEVPNVGYNFSSPDLGGVVVEWGNITSVYIVIIKFSPSLPLSLSPPLPLRLNDDYLTGSDISPVVVQISLTIAPWLEYITVEHLF